MSSDDSHLRSAAQVRSVACNLHSLTRQQLVERGEEANEVGGYFIVNGNEKLLRLLINQRRHYIMGMVRGAYARRGATFSEFATAIRCVAPDESSMSVRVHYLTNGSARLAFVLRRQEFFIPVRSCRPLTECPRLMTPLTRWRSCSARSSSAPTRRSLTRRALHSRPVPRACLMHLSSLPQVTAGTEGVTFAAERVEIMLQETARLGMRTRAQCLAYLGRHFRPVRAARECRLLRTLG